MKSAFIAGAFAATAALGQTTKQSDPFFLKLTSSNSSIDGRFLYACHSGAALETLCLGTSETPATDKNSALFYLNTTVYEGRESDVGTLVWNLKLAVGADGTQQSVSEPMTLQFNAGTNVALTWFSPSPAGPPSVGFNNSALFIDTYPDDSIFRDATYPESVAVRRASNWYACWVMAGSYFYNALAWVTSGEPHNPTCQSVGVVKVDAAA